MFIFNKKGISVIEVLVSIGVLSIVISGSMAMFSVLRKDLRFIEQKMSLISLEKNLVVYSSNEDICKKAFDDINAVYPNTSIPASITLNKVFASASTTLILAENGKPLIPTQSDFKISSIKINSITPISGNNYSGYLEISTDGANIPLKPISIRVVIKSTTSGGDTTFTGCATSASENALAGISCGNGKYLQGFDSSGSPICKTVPTGGGGSGGSSPNPPTYDWVYTSYSGTGAPVQGNPPASSCNASRLGNSVVTWSRDEYVCAPVGGCCTTACGAFPGGCINQGDTMPSCHYVARCSQTN